MTPIRAAQAKFPEGRVTVWLHVKDPCLGAIYSFTLVGMRSLFLVLVFGLALDVYSNFDPFESVSPKERRSFGVSEIEEVVISLGNESASWVNGLGFVIRKPAEVLLSGEVSRMLYLEQFGTNKVSSWSHTEPVGSPRICSFVFVLYDGEREFFPIEECNKDQHPLLYHIIGSYAPERFEEYRREKEQFLERIKP